VSKQVERWSSFGRCVVPDTSMFIQHPDKLKVGRPVAGLGGQCGARPLSLGTRSGDAQLAHQPLDCAPRHRD
jgi:hypothetical protein